MFECCEMGLSLEERLCWSGTVFHYSPTLADPTCGKSADECFIPLTRRGGIGGEFGWPTLVMETGVPGSLVRLREDVRWWFGCSGGDVRVVIVLVVDRGCKTVGLEKWLLGEPGEEPYVAQMVRITMSSATGDLPLVIDFGGAVGSGYFEREERCPRCADAS